MHLASFAYNCLRLLGQLGLTGEIAPIRQPAKRRRLKTVLQEIMYRAAKFVEHARRLVLDFGHNFADHVKVSLKGVGRWTVEMFLIYTLERSDILPVDDSGVREGYRRLKGMEKTPTPRQMREIGQDWSPYRTVAAWYLWRIPTRG